MPSIYPGILVCHVIRLPHHLTSTSVLCFDRRRRRQRRRWKGHDMLENPWQLTACGRMAPVTSPCALPYLLRKKPPDASEFVRRTGPISRARARPVSSLLLDKASVMRIAFSLSLPFSSANDSLTTALGSKIHGWWTQLELLPHSGRPACEAGYTPCILGSL